MPMAPTEAGPRTLRGAALAVAARVPWPAWWPLAQLGATVLALAPNDPVRRWNENFAVMTGRTPTRADTRRGLHSWARNTVQSLQLGRWSPAQTERRVLITADDRARLTTLAAEPGAVVGLPHQGSWDLCGAWACLNGMPVSSVAEQLDPDEFATFLRLREGLGFRIYGHRDPRVWPKLVADARERRLVCLMADRDFTRRGIPVVWHTASGPRAATMPSGPARLALRADSALLGIASHWHGARLHIVVSERLLPDPALGNDDERIADLTQQLCDFFADQVRAHPHDWHLLQPFFGLVDEAADEGSGR